MSKLKWILVLVAGAVLGAGAGAGLAGCQCRGGGGPGDTLMLAPDRPEGPVGVIRRTDLLIAYHRSPAHAEPLRRLRELHAAAGAEGEGGVDLVASAERFGAMWQEISHRQLAQREPLYTVVLGVQDELAALMERHGLSQVVEAGPGVEGRDITDELVGMLTASSSGAGIP